MTTIPSTNDYTLIQKQFLCCFPIKLVDWKCLDEPVQLWDQRDLIAATCGHKLNQRYPVRPQYQEAFVKRFLQILEDCEEIHDTVYSSLCGPLMSKDADLQTYAYKHYLIDEPFNRTITMRESNSIVSEGTTGLCTWGAALALTEFLLYHTRLVNAKNILEIGAGAGLMGIVLKSCLPVGEVVLTDGSMSCVELMRENVALNFDEGSTDVPKCAQLEWDKLDEFKWDAFPVPDVLMATDVIYDESQFDALVKTFDYILERHPKDRELHILQAHTLRNTETWDKYLDKLTEHNYEYIFHPPSPHQKRYFCRVEGNCHIAIFTITKKKSN